MEDETWPDAEDIHLNRSSPA